MMKQKILDFIRKLAGTKDLPAQIAGLSRRLDLLEQTQKELLFPLPFLSSKKNSNGPQFIVTLTSYGKRIHTTLPYTLFSVFRQSMLPDRIVLWLSEKTMTPKLEFFREHGLEINFCEDVKSYKKLVPAIKEFPDDVLVTIDDDTYYQPLWFLNLVNAYRQNPTQIHCCRAHEITLGKKGDVLPYLQWNSEVKQINNQNRFFPTGVGGILYPPNSLDKTVTDAPVFMDVAPTADDIWFWAMAKLNGTEYGLVTDGQMQYFDISSETDEHLYKINAEAGLNDKQLKAVLQKFPKLNGMLAGHG